MKNTEEAFHWIIQIIKSKDIPFRISGGFAARLYGASRDLADIDIDIPDEYFDLILDEIKDYIIYGPVQYKDEEWDLYLATLNYKGQLIDLAGSSKSNIFDKNTDTWVKFKVDYEDFELFDIFGIIVPVIKKEDLINYKLKLKREVDIIDVNELLK